MGDRTSGNGWNVTGEGDVLHDAGRAFLRGAVSLALALSLVPSRSMEALAEELRSLDAREEAAPSAIPALAGKDGELPAAREDHGADEEGGSNGQGADEDAEERADREAPFVLGASISGARVPRPYGGQESKDLCDGIQFLSADAQDVAITLRAHDQSGISSVVLFDPRGVYNLPEGGYACGPDEQIEVTIPLIDDAPFRDDIVLTFADGVGNERTWSLGAGGTITVGSCVEEAENVDLTANGVALGHPRAIVIDHDDPVVTLSGIDEGVDYVQPGTKVLLEVSDAQLESLRERDPQRKVATLRWRATREGGEESEEAITVCDLDESGRATIELEKDGRYSIEACLTDLAGRTSSHVKTKEVAIDTTPPAFTVVFDQDEGDPTSDEPTLFDAPRTATIAVVEDNFDEGLMEVQTTHEGWTSAEPEVGTWEHDGDTHTLVVHFGEGEGWELSVCGQDEAGNRAHLEGADDVLAYRSKQFNIDLTAPTITCDFDERRRSMATVEGEVAYFASELDLTVTLSDRHLDQESLAVVVDGKPVDTGAWDVGEAEDDTVTKTLVVHYAEGPHQTPEVLACDHAGHQARLEPVPFVVDRTAPELCSVTTSGEPAAHGREHPGDDPTLFFDRPTSLTFDVRDNLGIGSVRLVDPNGIYSASAEGEGFERGDTQVTLSVELREGDGTQGTAFGRDAYLEATDLAGNYRIWTLDSSGKVVDETGSSPENVSLNNGGLHPTALVKDTVPPMVMLSGVEAGSYYNAAQLLHAQVEELNVAYLQRFDASRSVLRITSWTADAQRQPSVLEVPLSLFAGSGSSYAFDYPFAEDGHYAIEAQLVDMANNVSAKEFIGEFTIDKTAPAITLSWDSDAAPTDGYFNTPRTATIVVQEHNFDPGLIDVDTTGSVSSWKSIGDVHTCEVSFGEGGPHRLVVGGRDLAGNVANALKEPVFVVDTTPPSISFGGMAQRSTAQGETTESILEQGGAYNGAVAPSVTFDDDRDLDVESVSLSLRGSKLGEVGEAFPHEVAGGRRSWVVTYEDLGRTKEEGGLPYDIGVDDVYTLVARVRDLAGNEAESSISFSVNRYGSNYLVTAVEGGREVDLSDNPILKDAPTITVREINVSGADPQGTQRVLKEYANRTSVMERHDDGLGGFSLKEIAHDVGNHGWAEYVYTIKSANFGKGSDSDAGDGGQGTYRINVTSDDRAGNANTTAEYWWSDAAREEAKAKAATASFTLDELGPAIDSVDVPARVEPGTSYEASFHVTDAITRGNDVEVWVDGQRVPAQHEGRDLSSGELVGEGSFSFRIPARSFAARKVVIRVSDYARRMDQREVAGLFVTTLIPEALLVLCLLVAARFAYRKSQKE